MRETKGREGVAALKAMAKVTEKISGELAGIASFLYIYTRRGVNNFQGYRAAIVYTKIYRSKTRKRDNIFLTFYSNYI